MTMLTKSYKGYFLHFNSERGDVRVQTPDYDTFGVFKTEQTAKKHIRDDIASHTRSKNPASRPEVHVDIDSHNTNPTPRIGTKRPRRVSQVTKKPPTRRLIARRKANDEPGYYPNPTGRLFTHYVSQVKHGASMRVGEMVCLTLDATTAAEIANVLNLHRDPSVVFKSHKLARPVQE